MGALDHDDVASVLIVLRQQTAPVGGDSQTGDGSIGWFRKQRNRLDDSARQVQHFQPGDRWAVWRLRNRFGRKATRQQRRAAAFPRTPPGNPPRSRASPSSYSSYEFDLVHWPVRRDHSDRSVIGRSSSI